MKKTEFNRLVKQLTELAQTKPAQFKRDFRRICLITYAYPIVLAVLSLALIGCAITLLVHSMDGLLWQVPMLVIGLLILHALVGALWFRSSPPGGMVMDKVSSRQLRADIKQLREVTNCPKIHEILFTVEVNASVVQVPRLLNLFFPKNYLIIGVPLLYMFTPSQLKAVLAHELGHIVNRDGESGSFFFRTVVTWGRLAGINSEKRSWRHYLFLPLFNWLAPRLNAWQKVESRQAEYRADAFAAKFASGEDIAASLCKLEATMGFLNKEVMDRIRVEQYYHREPPAGLMQRIVKLTTQDLWVRRGPYYVQRAMQMRTMPTDTHPSLSDRLSSVGVAPLTRFQIERSAGEHYFGSTDLIQELDEHWCRSMMYPWRIQHEVLREQEKLIHHTKAVIKNGDAVAAHYWRLANLMLEIYGPRDSLKHFQEFVRRYPSISRGQLALGHVMFRLEMPGCLQHLYKAMEGDPYCYLDAALIAYEWCLRSGDEASANQLESHIDFYYDNAEAYHKERDEVKKDDMFSIPSISNEDWANIQETCVQFHEIIRRVVLLQKQVQHFQHYPLYVLGIAAKCSDDEAKELIEALQNLILVTGNVVVYDMDSVKFIQRASKRLNNPYVDDDLLVEK